MENPNAFIGKTSHPTDDEISSALGATAEIWHQFVDWLAEQEVTEQEWKSTSAKYGWSLLLKLKKRTIIYLAPCADCYRASFVLGDRAVAAARQSGLTKSTLDLLDKAPRYGEGTGLRLIVKASKDLAELRKLTLIKLAN
jgi:hypothetical protein